MFESTNKRSPAVGLKEAVMSGLAPDGGLYMPTEFPSLPNGFFSSSDGIAFTDVALEVATLLFKDDLPAGKLREIVYDAFDFDVPLRKLDESFYALELFHGPTCAFKDFGARFLARLLGHFAEESREGLTILVATSGDTGSAVANGFLGITGIKVIILYPSGRVSALQEKQLTGMGGNVTALEVGGSFDDCQRMVKEAFLDSELKRTMTLSSANSINVGRLLPQSFYYAYACVQLQAGGKPIVISVPCGNFGNLVAGLIAKRMGAPVARFVAATNRNDVVPQYFRTGEFIPRASMATISNAMDVGNPSNFARMLALYDHDVGKIRSDIHAASYTDKDTKKAILEVFTRYGYIMDPHGAVAYLGLRDFQEKNQGYEGVFLETADPAKFSEIIEPVIGKSVPIPVQLKTYLERTKQATSISNEFSALKAFLLARENI